MNKLKNSRKLFKIVLQLLVLVLIGGYITTSVVQSTFASNRDGKPNVIITINKDGSFTQEGNLFGDELLYPASVEDAEKGIGSISGVIRINNQYGRIEVTNFGVGVDKDKFVVGNEYPIDLVYSSFLNDVELKIEKGTLFAFDKTLVDYASLRDLLDGYTLDERDRFTINKGSIVDLKYTLHMAERAGNELQNVTADIEFYINVSGDKIIDDDDDNGGGHKDEGEVKSQSIAIPHWAHDCIITLLNHHVIVGYHHEIYTIEDYFNGTVDSVVYVNEVILPDRFVTRAETAVLIGRALGLEPDNTKTPPYVDDIPEWARGYINATTDAGIFTGYPSGEFKPDEYITREEMIAVITRAFNIKLEDSSLELSFKDKDEIGNWALEYVKAGYEKEIIEGYPDNTYRPKNYITRAETATIICKLKGWHPEHNNKN